MFFFVHLGHGTVEDAHPHLDNLFGYRVAAAVAGHGLVIDTGGYLSGKVGKQEQKKSG